MNIHHPRNPIPVPLHLPRSQGPPGITKPEDGIPRDVWDWGARGPLSSVFQLFSVWLHSGTIAKASPIHFLFQRGLDPLSGMGHHRGCCPGTQEKGLRAIAGWASQLPLNSRGLKPVSG